MNVLKCYTPDALLCILESFPSYSLAIKFLYVVNTCLDERHLKRLRKHFTKHIRGTKMQKYVLDGRLHREDDKPAIVEHNSDGTMRYIKFYEKGVFIRAIWYKNNRVNNISIRLGSRLYKSYCYHDNGMINKIKNKNGDYTTSSSIQYYDDGSVKAIYYSKDGKLNREGGAARYYYNQDGLLRFKQYWVNGIRIS